MVLSLLPDGRFDVALLVPLLAPVLSLQHIIYPMCRPSKGLYAMPLSVILARLLHLLIPSFHVDVVVLL